MNYPGKDADEAVQQNLSKVSFLRVEAIHWMLPTKLIELLFAGGCLLLVAPFLVGGPVLDKLPYVGGSMMVIAYLELAKRRAIWSGWYYGYEEGFKDAATAGLDDFGRSHDEDVHVAAINAVINRIKETEDAISAERLARREKILLDGLKRFQGFVVGWRSSKT